MPYALCMDERLDGWGKVQLDNIQLHLLSHAQQGDALLHQTAGCDAGDLCFVVLAGWILISLVMRMRGAGEELTQAA